MKTIIVYIRSGQKYQRVMQGRVTASEAQMAILKDGIGCQRVLSVKVVSQ